MTFTSNTPRQWHPPPIPQRRLLRTHQSNAYSMIASLGKENEPLLRMAIATKAFPDRPRSRQKILPTTSQQHNCPRRPWQPQGDALRQKSTDPSVKPTLPYEQLLLIWSLANSTLQKKIKNKTEKSNQTINRSSIGSPLTPVLTNTILPTLPINQPHPKENNASSSTYTLNNNPPNDEKNKTNKQKPTVKHPITTLLKHTQSLPTNTPTISTSPPLNLTLNLRSTANRSLDRNTPNEKKNKNDKDFHC